MEKNGVYEKEYEVTVNDIDCNNKMKESAFLKYMQEVAALHSKLYGYGINDTLKNNIVWIIFCWKLKVMNRPCWNEKIKIKTWLSKMDKLYYYRDFSVENEKGQIIAKAESQWIMFNIKEKKIEILREYYQNNFPKVYIDGYDCTIKKIKFDISKVDMNKVKIYEYTVSKRDLDTNYHMNNTMYLDIANEMLEDDALDKLNDLEIHYKTECKYGDKIKFVYEYLEDIINIYVLSEKDNKIHTVIILSR